MSTPPPAEQVRALVADAREDLRDQLVAGQVETLLGLEQAAAAVRRETARLHAATDRPVAELQALLNGLSERLADAATRAGEAGAESLESAAQALAARVQDGVRPLEQVGTALGERADAAEVRLASAMDAVAARLADVAEEVEQSATQLLRQQQVLVHQVANDEEERLARAEAARTAAEASWTSVVDTSGERLGRTVVALVDEAGAQLDARRDRLQDAVQLLEHAGAALVERADTATLQLHSVIDAAAARLADVVGEVEQSATQLLRQQQVLAHQVADDEEARLTRAEAARTAAEASWTSVVDTAGERLERTVGALVDEVGVQLDARVDRFAAESAGFRLELGGLLERWEAQEARRDARVDARVGRLVERTAGVLAQVTERFDTVAQDLVRRDRELEARRLDEFVRALGDLLARGGASGRGLRRRVLGSLERSSGEPDVLIPVGAAVDASVPAHDTAAPATAPAPQEPVLEEPLVATPARQRPAARRALPAAKAAPAVPTAEAARETAAAPPRVRRGRKRTTTEGEGTT